MESGVPLQHLKTEILQIFYFLKKCNVNKSLAGLSIAAKWDAAYLKNWTRDEQDMEYLNHYWHAWLMQHFLSKIFNFGAEICQFKVLEELEEHLLLCLVSFSSPCTVPEKPASLFPVEVPQSSPHAHARDPYRQNCPWTALSSPPNRQYSLTNTRVFIPSPLKC